MVYLVMNGRRSNEVASSRQFSISFTSCLFCKTTSCLYINQVSGHCKWDFKLMSKIVFIFFFIFVFLPLPLKWTFGDALIVSVTGAHVTH